jgi:transposase
MARSSLEHRNWRRAMEVVNARCAGLDVHKRTVVACVRVPVGRRERRSIVRTFGTTTPELLELLTWLTEREVGKVAMESTGVYWRPVYHVLEGSFDEILLVNAQHVKAVPGRKSDVKDCEWLAQLLEHGLLRGSFVPPEPIRDLRDLTRFRKTLIRERSSHVRRVQKTLELANIKLSSVATDIMGKSGRAMLEALIEGRRDPKQLAELSLGVLRKKRAALETALTGRVREHHAFLLRQQLTVIDDLDDRIRELDMRIEDCMRPFAEQLTRICTIPGVAQRTAEALVAEIGIDMERFPSPGHLASWARVCPGTHQSGDRRRSASIGKGNNWLKATLIEAAWAASRTKRSYYSAQFKRLRTRRGPKKAVVAVAHSMLHAYWHILHDRTEHRDLGPAHFDDARRDHLRRHHLKRLRDLGFKVTVEEAA